MRATVSMGIQLALRGLIEETFPPSLDGPTITTVFGHGAGALSPGLDFTVDASNVDTADPNNDVVILIPPNAPDFLLSVEGILGGVDGAFEARHWLQAAKAVWDAIKSIYETAAGLAALGDTNVVIHGSGLSTDGLEYIVFPPAPTHINCNLVPRTGYLVPLRLGVGYGPAVTVLVPAESC